MNLFLYKHSFLLGMYPRVHPLGYTVDSCSASTVCQNIFQNGCINLFSFQQCLKLPVFLYCHQHLILLSFFHCSHLDGGVVLSHCSFNLYFLKKHLLDSLSTNYVLGLGLHAGRGRVADRHIDGIHQRVRELVEVCARH